MLWKKRYTVLYHKPSASWVLHIPNPDQIKYVQCKLATITARTGMQFHNLSPLDKLDVERMGLLKVYQTPCHWMPSRSIPGTDPAEEPEAEEPVEIETTGSEQSEEQSLEAWLQANDMLRTVEAMVEVNEDVLAMVKRGYDHFTYQERSLVQVLSPHVLQYFAQELAKKLADREFLTVGPVVEELTVYPKVRMVASRQLEWLLFRLAKNNVTPIKEVAFYPVFLHHYLTISLVQNRAKACQKASELWQLWTGEALPKELPDDVKLRVVALRQSKEACQCAICCRPMLRAVGGDVFCSPACGRYCCAEHKVAKVAVHPSHLMADPDDVQMVSTVVGAMTKLNDAFACRDGPRRPQALNPEIAEAVREMKETGCCSQGFCSKHAEANRRQCLALRLMRQTNEIRWEELETERDRLATIFRPPRFEQTYACPVCAPQLVEPAPQQEPVAQIDLDKFEVFEKAREAGYKGGFDDFDPDAYRAQKRRRWKDASEADRARLWNPVPGSFMLFPEPE